MLESIFMMTNALSMPSGSTTPGVCRRLPAGRYLVTFQMQSQLMSTWPAFQASGDPRLLYCRYCDRKCGIGTLAGGSLMSAFDVSIIGTCSVVRPMRLSLTGGSWLAVKNL